MAETIIIAIKSFTEGMRTFVSPWNQVYEPPKREHRSIDYYFGRVGTYLARANARYVEEHPEVVDAI